MLFFSAISNMFMYVYTVYIFLRMRLFLTSNIPSCCCMLNAIHTRLIHSPTNPWCCGGVGNTIHPYLENFHATHRSAREILTIGTISGSYALLSFQSSPSIEILPYKFVDCPCLYLSQGCHISNRKYKRKI